MDRRGIDIDTEAMAEAETGVMQLQAEEASSTTESWKENRFFPRDSGGSVALQSPHLEISSLRNFERINSCCSKP